MNGAPRSAVIGIGNDYRRDDAVGLEVARMVRRADPPHAKVVVGVSDEYALLNVWQHCHVVYLVDCTRAGADPGTIRKFDVRNESIPSGIFDSVSTHSLNLVESVELSRALGRLPRELTLFGIEGADFSHGRGLTKQVRAAAVRVAGLITRSCEPVPYVVAE
jgi:hydrogenase maturation protease